MAVRRNSAQGTDPSSHSSSECQERSNYPRLKSNETAPTGWPDRSRYSIRVLGDKINHVTQALGSRSALVTQSLSSRSALVTHSLSSGIDPVTHNYGQPECSYYPEKMSSQSAPTTRISIFVQSFLWLMVTLYKIIIALFIRFIWQPP